MKLRPRKMRKDLQKSRNKDIDECVRHASLLFNIIGSAAISASKNDLIDCNMNYSDYGLVVLKFGKSDAGAL